MHAHQPIFLKLPTPYIHLFGATVLQLVVLALAPPRLVQQSLNLVFTVWMAAAAATAAGRQRVFWVTLALGWTPALLELLVPSTVTPLGLQIFKETLWMLFPFYLSARLVAPLFAEGEVSYRELVGAVTVYLLAGMGFADAFEIIYQYDPGAISFGATALGGPPALTDFLYFSFVTLATLGYGDVSPVSPLARSTAVAEAILGLLYVSILVGRMVGLHIVSAMPGNVGSGASRDEALP